MMVKVAVVALMCYVKLTPSVTDIVIMQRQQRMQEQALGSMINTLSVCALTQNQSCKWNGWTGPAVFPALKSSAAQTTDLGLPLNGGRDRLKVLEMYLGWCFCYRVEHCLTNPYACLLISSKIYQRLWINMYQQSRKSTQARKDL